MSEPDRIWKAGEEIYIAFEGRSSLGHVILASSNGYSLALGFESILGPYVGSMPVLFDASTGFFRDLITSRIVMLSEVQESDRT